MYNFLDWIRELMRRNSTDDAPETVFLGDEASITDSLVAELREVGQPEVRSPQY